MFHINTHIHGSLTTPEDMCMNFHGCVCFLTLVSFTTSLRRVEQACIYDQLELIKFNEEDKV